MLWQYNIVYLQVMGAKCKCRRYQLRKSHYFLWIDALICYCNPVWNKKNSKWWELIHLGKYNAHLSYKRHLQRYFYHSLFLGNLILSQLEVFLNGLLPRLSLIRTLRVWVNSACAVIFALLLVDAIANVSHMLNIHEYNIRNRIIMRSHDVKTTFIRVCQNQNSKLEKNLRIEPGNTLWIYLNLYIFLAAIYIIR